MFIFRVLRYLKYIIFSQHKQGHGIHSPFVFNLISRVFRNKTDANIVCSIEKTRKRLLSDPGLIIVKDPCTGTESLKTNLRKVSDIARYSAVPLKYGVLLSNLAAEFGRPLIIEFGTSFGISTMYMAASCPEASVITIEGCTSISEIAKFNFAEAGLKNIRIFTGSFENTLSEITGLNIQPGLVFIDGNHRKEPVINYFTKMANIAGKDTVIVIDDINYSGEMMEAWDEIRNFVNVSVTIDLFRMGIVFFREGIARYDYIIRY